MGFSITIVVVIVVIIVIIVIRSTTVLCCTFYVEISPNFANTKYCSVSIS